ncbi:hypothetical protein [Streptomyces sp. NPDC005507]|uniref:hypothetical protein n=1 Tax=Streptomyces sp. NPDC005507 TaxID=3154885 RepID=UPI0033AFBC0A
MAVEQSVAAGGRRPDGRVTAAATVRLREASRALRAHLDALPAEFHFGGPADRFLAESAFPFARWRFDCADSLIGSGIGGTVVGALARSLFEDGLRWQWIGQSPAERRPTLLAGMLLERDRICSYLEEHEVSCLNLPRWFVPLSGVTDLTGRSLEWLSAPDAPDADELLDTFLASSPAAPDPAKLTGGRVQDLLDTARAMLAMSGLRGAVMVLGHAGHGNLLGLQSSVSADGVPGHDLRADHEALFLHVAAVGVTVTLLGVCCAVPECWPAEVDQAGFLGTAVQLTQEVVQAANAVHGLGQAQPVSAPAKVRQHRRVSRLRPAVLVAAGDVLPDVASVDGVIAAVTEYQTAVDSWCPDPWAHGDPKLASVLAQAGARSAFDTVMSTYDQHAAVSAVFAARMLLEEAARFTWLTHDPEDGTFLERSKRYFDEFRARKKKTIALFAGNGVGLRAAKRLFELPGNVVEGPDDVAKGRKPLPPIDQLLLAMGAPYPEPGWLPVAYSLLSQVTHSTPLGLTHMARFLDGTLHAGEPSPEMLALTLDTACLASARLLGTSGLLLDQGSKTAQNYALELARRAYAVHDAARMVHWLD